MPRRDSRIVVLVHGWSVHDTAAYGKLPDRLEREARRAGGPALDVRNIWLGKYVSFRDEVRIEDLARAFQAALEREIGAEMAAGRRFACITHSTGGPVIRDWWDRHYLATDRACPMSHLVMLAPANFGSALAQLGKSRIGRLKSWFQGIEPGAGVLEWLELGSPESWDLNARWIRDSTRVLAAETPVWPFVLIGQTIDRKLYDHLNPYTGENGSDGVVRLAAANLNAAHLRLFQQGPARPRGLPGSKLELESAHEAAPTAFGVLPGLAHSGEEIGILTSIRDDTRRHPTVDAILRCLSVSNVDAYGALRAELAVDSARVQDAELTEKGARSLLPNTWFIHDRCAMVIFRVTDNHGHAVEDFDLLLTAGAAGDPNKLPRGFLIDRQRNQRHRGTLALYLNYDIMTGTDAVAAEGRRLREPRPGAGHLGIRIVPRPGEGLVHYVPCELKASVANLERLLAPNQTTLVDVVLRRVVREGTFRMTRDRAPRDFAKEKGGRPIG